jgi:hypothetical protein
LTLPTTAPTVAAMRTLREVLAIAAGALAVFWWLMP